MRKIMSFTLGVLSDGRRHGLGHFPTSDHGLARAASVDESARDDEERATLPVQQYDAI